MKVRGHLHTLPASYRENGQSPYRIEEEYVPGFGEEK
jgi:hypothetical protein